MARFHFTFFDAKPNPNQFKHINLLLMLETQTNIWFPGHLTRQFQQIGISCIRFNREQLDTNLENIKQDISEKIDVWPISDSGRASLAMQILSETMEIIEYEIDMPKMTIPCKVTFVVDEIGSSMVPASNHSIQSLETTNAVANEDGNCARCTICLEDLPVGHEALRMPCSHVFHGECIQEWLNTSHLCPICRYEMPTN